MAATVSTLPPPVSRVADTARPSGRRLRSAAAIPPPPATPLSVVDRHENKPFPCQQETCSDAAEVTARVAVEGGMSTVVMFCRACARRLPSHVRAVPLAKVLG